jgi:hypothetical protein
MKTFFEKITFASGSFIFVNYTSTVLDATLERKWIAKLTPTINGEEKESKEMSPSDSLTIARKRVWTLAAEGEKALGGKLLTKKEKAAYA